jgi:hypothetical protein
MHLVINSPPYIRRDHAKEAAHTPPLLSSNTAIAPASRGFCKACFEKDLRAITALWPRVCEFVLSVTTTLPFREDTETLRTGSDHSEATTNTQLHCCSPAVLRFSVWLTPIHCRKGTPRL